MRITYDDVADAVYIYLTDELQDLDTRVVDEDINFDFDMANRLVGIEVLDASKRLHLEYILPTAEKLDELSFKWHKLRRELLRRKQAGEPVETTEQHVRNWIKEVGDDYAVLLSDRSKKGNLRKITRVELEDRDIERHIGKRRIIVALREIGGYS